ncbi:MAG TPA: hypothetical protein VF794_15410 [Archangium sp.]
MSRRATLCCGDVLGPAPKRGGCSQDALRGTGGAGLFYCFAAD